MTKRILLMLTLFFLLLTCACTGAADGPTPSAASEPAGQGDFLPPEGYATVVRVTINPEFDLYLADDGDVLAVHPLNEDALAVIEDVAYEGRGVADVVRDIAAVAADKGYLKEDGEIRIEVVLTVLEEQTVRETVLQRASEGVAAFSREKGMTVNTFAAVTEDAFVGEIPADAAQPPVTGSDDPVPGSQEQGDSGSRGGSGEGDSGSRGGSGEGCSVCRGSGKCGYCGAKGSYACEMCKGAGSLPCTRPGCENGKLKCSCGDGKCHVCHGAGRLACTTCNGSDPGCPYCHGTGYGPCNGCPGDGLCSQCKGTGYAGTDEQCGGTGRETCFPCRGTGVTECSQCHGDGKCPACHGTGKKQ